MRVLIAEDDEACALVLERVLRQHGHDVERVTDGASALRRVADGGIDLLLTDWMMPEMDGTTLLRRLRSETTQPPHAVMMSNLDSDLARAHALSCGAADFLPKPLHVEAVLGVLERFVESRAATPEPLDAAPEAETAEADAAAPSGTIPVLIATGTGGPTALRQLLKGVDYRLPACFVIAMHGHAWVIEALLPKLQTEIDLPVEMAEDAVNLQPGHVLVIPGDQLAEFDADGCLRFERDTRGVGSSPRADLLFQSAAIAFGQACIGIVLTGQGSDGTQGSAAIVSAGGQVLVHEPGEAIASAMPQSIVTLGIDHATYALADLGPAVNQRVGERAGLPSDEA